MAGDNTPATMPPAGGGSTVDDRNRPDGGQNSTPAVTNDKSKSAEDKTKKSDEKSGKAEDKSKKGADDKSRNPKEGMAKLLGEKSPAARVLGAGGTSFKDTGDDDPENEESAAAKGAKRVVKRAAKAGAAAATPYAVMMALLLLLLSYLKSLFFALVAMVLNFFAWLWGIVVAVVNFIGGVFGFLWGALTTPFAILGAVGAAIGGALVATVAIGASLFALLAGWWGIFTGANDSVSAASCAPSSSSIAETIGGPTDAKTEEQAKIVYSVFKTWGMSDINISGILGNWEAESGIDSTSVESIYDEPYRIGPRKKQAWEGNFTHIAGQSHGGIGLGQWSNGRTTMLLDYAKANNVNWYDIGTQLKFMAEGDAPSMIAIFKNMISTPQASPRDAALYFHHEWEISADKEAGLNNRASKAETWFKKISGWTVDQGLVKSTVGDFIVGGTNQGPKLASSNNCLPGSVTAGTPRDGGMSAVEAQALVALFNQEGDRFLDGRYGEHGGPGSCGSNHAMNCVSFSTYFVNKYTSFQSYPQGNGISTAYTIARVTGKPMSKVPSAYSVGSGPGSSSAGHTLVVLSVAGEQVTVAEAGWCAYMGRVRVTTVSELQSTGWMFVDMSDAMLPTPMSK